jgi:hypothetical protein
VGWVKVSTLASVIRLTHQSVSLFFHNSQYRISTSTIGVEAGISKDSSTYHALSSGFCRERDRVFCLNEGFQLRSGGFAANTFRIALTCLRRITQKKTF